MTPRTTVTVGLATAGGTIGAGSVDHSGVDRGTAIVHDSDPVICETGVDGEGEETESDGGYLGEHLGLTKGCVQGFGERRD